MFSFAQLDTDETEKFLNEFAQCGWEVPTVGNLAIVPYMKFSIFSIRNLHINVAHIKCVTFAIGKTLFDSELASEWLVHNIKLIRSASTIVACDKLGKLTKYL